MSIQSDVNDAINFNINEISLLQFQNNLIQSINWSAPVDEITWHQICETPLRNSNALSVLVKNTFPDATNIIVHCNYVYFNLFDFKIQIPTSRQLGINVDLSWYRKDCSKPNLYISPLQSKWIKYFELLDNNNSRLDLIRLVVPEYIPNWLAPFAYYLKYKYTIPDRLSFENSISNIQSNYDKQISKYNQERLLIHNKTIALKNSVLPVIDSFSTSHYNYNNSNQYSITDILSFENLS